MRDDVITVAIGLVVALAFSKLVEAFTDSVINPLVAAAQPDSAFGLGVQLGEEGNETTFMDFGALISGIVYFIVFIDRKSTRLNSSHVASSYAVFCLKKKNP